jgi:hypothetical protein
MRKSWIIPVVLAGGASGPTYLLYDSFTTDLAAGAVNATTSESPVATGGGVTRTVADANSKLSLSSGALVIITGGSAIGNPGIWYAQVTRTGGTALLVSITPGTTARTAFGWDNTQTGGLSDGFHFATSSTLQAYVSGLGIAVGVYTNTTYQAAVILRGTGTWHIIKGDAFTNARLLWVNDTNNGNFYPSIGIISAAGEGVSADALRIPDPAVATQLYVIVPLAYDTFTRANGALGNSETTGPDSQTVGALTWTAQIGTWAVATNVAAASALDPDLAIATVPTTSADAIVDINVTRTAGSAGGVARYADSSNYLRFSTDGTNALCEQVVAGTPTTLRTAAVTYGAGNTLRLMLNGTEGRLFYNNLAVGAVFTVPSSSAGAHGLYTTNTGNSLDGFEAWDTGNTSGAYDALFTSYP